MHSYHFPQGWARPATLADAPTYRADLGTGHEHYWTRRPSFVRLEAVWQRRTCGCGEEQLRQASYEEGRGCGLWADSALALEARRKALERYQYFEVEQGAR